jgi:hypothetical protein
LPWQRFCGKHQHTSMSHKYHSSCRGRIWPKKVGRAELGFVDFKAPVLANHRTRQAAQSSEGGYVFTVLRIKSRPVHMRYYAIFGPGALTAT